MAELFSPRLTQFHQMAVASLSASEVTDGWDEFGGDEYLEPLQVLLRSLDEQSDMTDLNAMQVEQMIVGALRGRLYSEFFKQQNPHYRSQTISRPIFIIGLPRSGTTALHKMLVADPKHQGIEYWLGQTPMPRPPREQWSVQDQDQAVSRTKVLIDKILINTALINNASNS